MASIVDFQIDDQLTFLENDNSNAKSNLYKLFFYDENDNDWYLNSSTLNQFYTDKKINLGHDNFPTILFINSFLCDEPFPDLNSDENDQIFIYALCSKPLSKLSHNIKFRRVMKAVTLNLHVPERKRNMINISQIISKIYIFLSLMSNIQIIVLNKESCFDQLDFLYNLENLTKPRKTFLNDPSEESDDENDNIKESVTPLIKFSKTLFLVNYENENYFNEIDKRIQNNNYFMKMPSSRILMKMPSTSMPK